MSASQTLRVNGRDVEISAEPGTPLATVLREQLGLASVQDDFATRLTGASTVIVDEFAVLAALVPVAGVIDRNIVTAEGLSDHPLAKAFAQHGVDQLPAAAALLVASAALLAANPRPTIDDIKRGLAGVRCARTGYRDVIAAVRDAASHIANAVEVRS